MLMPMVLAQLPAAGKPSKDLHVPTLVDEAIRFVDALLDGGAPGPASARVATLRDTASAPTNEPTLELVVTSRSRLLAVLRVLSARDRFRFGPPFVVVRVVALAAFTRVTRQRQLSHGANGDSRPLSDIDCPKFVVAKRSRVRRARRMAHRAWGRQEAPT